LSRSDFKRCLGCWLLLLLPFGRFGRQERHSHLSSHDND
jgi:hypothetical protein